MNQRSNDRRLLVLGVCLAGVLGLGLGTLRGDGGREARAGAWESEPRSDVPLLVTSSLGANSAILFVLDPDGQRLAAYEAIPGQAGGLRLLGARKIEFDLLLSRYRDLSEMSPDELKEHYTDQGEENSGAGDRDQ